MSAEINDFATAQNLGIAAGNYTAVAGGSAAMSATMRGLSTATHAHNMSAVASTDTFFGDYKNADLDEVIKPVTVVEPGSQEWNALQKDSDEDEGNESSIEF